MLKIKKRTIYYLILAIIILAYPTKLGLEYLSKGILNKQITKFLQKNYNKDLNFKMDKLKISFVNLLRLKLKFESENLELSNLAKVESMNSSLDLWELARREEFHIESLNINGANLVLENKEVKQKFSLNDLKIKVDKLIVNSPNNKVAANYVIKNKELDLQGKLKLSGKKNYCSLDGKGQVKDLELKPLLLVLTSKKPGLTGSLSLDNLKFKSHGANGSELGSNINLSADMSIKDGILYLLDYIVKTKKVVDSVLPVGKVLDVFESVNPTNLISRDAAEEKFKASLNSDNSKFTSMFAKLRVEEETAFLDEIDIDTPIMGVHGSGRTGFDQKLLYRVDVSLAGLPILPILITGKSNLPLVLIDLEGYPRRRVKKFLKLFRK